MANSKIPNITLTDTLNTQRRRINQLLDSVGDMSLTSIDQTSGRSTFAGSRPTIGEALQEHEAKLDSADTIKVRTPKLDVYDSSSTSRLAGNLKVDTNVDIGGSLTVHGIVNMKAGSSGTVTLTSLSFKSKAIFVSSTGSLSFKIASTLSFGESSDLSTFTSNRIVFPAYL